MPELIENKWCYHKACLWWMVQTTFYAWIAPWVLLAVLFTLFRPSVQTIREYAITMATSEQSAWSELPKMWWSVSLVIAVMVIALRFPNSPIWRLLEDRLLEPAGQRIERAWERCSGRWRKAIQYSVTVVGLSAIALAVVALSHQHSEQPQGIAALPSAVPAPLPTAAAAIALPDGSLLSGTADVTKQAKFSYLVRFQEHKEHSHE